MGAAAWGTVARPLGLAALHLGHIDEGLDHLGRAVEGCARMGARPWLVEAQLDLAFALLRVGRDDDPRLPELVGEALLTARQLGLARFVEQAEGLRSRVRTAFPRPPVAAPVGRPTVSVLGAFEVASADGRVARWTSRKARELLKILVARRGAPVHREVLMDLLWPDVDPATLSNRLSVALSTVRRALDPDRLQSSNELVAADSAALRLRRRCGIRDRARGRRGRAGHRTAVGIGSLLGRWPGRTARGARRSRGGRCRCSADHPRGR